MKIKGWGGGGEGNLPPAFCKLVEYKGKNLFQTHTGNAEPQSCVLEVWLTRQPTDLSRLCTKSPAIKIKGEFGNFLWFGLLSNFPGSGCQYHINTLTASQVGHSKASAGCRGVEAH